MSLNCISLLFSSGSCLVLIIFVTKPILLPFSLPLLPTGPRLVGWMANYFYFEHKQQCIHLLPCDATLGKLIWKVPCCEEEILKVKKRSFHFPYTFGMFHVLRGIHSWAVIHHSSWCTYILCHNHRFWLFFIIFKLSGL